MRIFEDSMKGEEWKYINDFPEDYEISSFGRVRSKLRTKVRSNGRPQTYKPKLLAMQLHNTGYYRVRLCVNGKKVSRSVHRLVAEAFLDNLNFKEEVNHVDGNKLNNNVLNLEWVTKNENMEHATVTGLIDNPFGTTARNFHGTTFAWKGDECCYIMNGNKEITEAGFCYKQVSACIRGKQNTHKGYTFTRGE